MKRRLAVALAAVSVLAAGIAHAGESSREEICRLIEAASAKRGLPPEFLTRLIWRESSFRASARSGAGAQGIAQFMPGTAAGRGLSDPFDPEAAIPASAAYLAELRDRFGSLGRAAAAYNAGPTRVSRWLSGVAGLPDETRAHVRFITGAEPDPSGGDTTTLERDCLTTLAAIRAMPRQEAGSGLEPAIARWGVQLVANTDKAAALREFATLRTRYASVMGEQRPTILTTRLGGKGRRSFYRVRIAFSERRDADTLCRKLRGIGGSCLTVVN